MGDKTLQFSPRLAAILRDAHRKISVLGAAGDHHDLYAYVRVTMGVLTQVDSFYVAFFRDNGTVVFPYNFDGKEYFDPDVHSYSPDGLGAWLQRHDRPYRYAMDDGYLVHRGYSYGDTRKVAQDCVAVPLVDTSADTRKVIGTACVQSYRPGVYDDEAVKAFQWLADAVSTVLARERQDVADRAALSEEGWTGPDWQGSLPISLNEVIEDFTNKLAALRREVDIIATTMGDGDRLARLADLLERMQTETVELMLRPSLDAVDVLAKLTPREKEIARLIADGLSNEEIAVRLVIAESTVKTHVTRVLRKFGVRQRSAIVARLHPFG